MNKDAEFDKKLEDIFKNMETGTEFVSNISRYFSLIDDNFFDGFISIINQFCSHLKNNNITVEEASTVILDKIEKELNSDKGVNPNDSMKMMLEFLKTLNPAYEQIAINLLNDTKIKKGNSLESRAYNVVLSGNEYDTSIMTHELVHSFVMSEDFLNVEFNSRFPEEEYRPLFYIISEINSYVSQLLLSGFDEVKYGMINDRYDWLLPMMLLADLKRRPNHIKYLENLSTNLKKINHGEETAGVREIFTRVSVNASDKRYNSQVEFSELMIWLSHSFGIVIASYIYSKALEDPNNMTMFLGIEKALTMSGSDSDVFKCLESLGIPCFKNGKLALDDESVIKLKNALIEVFDMCWQKKPLKGYLIFNQDPMISEECVDSCNKMFGENTNMPKQK